MTDAARGPGAEAAVDPQDDPENSDRSDRPDRPDRLDRTDPPGLPLGALRSYLDREAPGLLAGPLTGRVVAGGKSNLTYVVGDGARTVVVRRPPLGHVLATAHDMVREHRVITALRDTPVPVPDTYAVCPTDDVVGAPFYVMEHVDGTPYRTAAQLGVLGAERTRAVAERMIDTLVDLHRVDPDAVGLGDLRRTGSYLERQLRRWHRQVHESTVQDLDVVDAVHARLVARAAELPPSDVRIAHGDYRLGNVAVGPDGTVRAVFDWELATLGDPLADLGWLIASWARPDDAVTATLPGPSLVDGFPERDELVDRYARRSGRDVGDLAFYVAFARWRSACIGAGVYSRYVGGAMGGAAEADGGAARLASIQVQAQAALDALGG